MTKFFFSGQRLHPDCIFNIMEKLLSQMNDPMLWRNHLIQPMSDLDREIVVEKELHAAWSRGCLS
jgi:hypothetical protein